MPTPNRLNRAPPPLPCPWLRYDYPEIRLPLHDRNLALNLSTAVRMLLPARPQPGSNGPAAAATH